MSDVTPGSSPAPRREEPVLGDQDATPPQPAPIDPVGAPQPPVSAPQPSFGDPSGVTQPVSGEPQAPHDPAPPAPRKKRGLLILSIALGVVLLGVIAAVVWLFLQLSDAQTRIDDQEQQIQEQKDQILEQRELIEKKEVFGAAMNRLHDTIEPLVGLPFASLVPWNTYDALAERAWVNRRDAAGLDRNTAEVEAATAELAARQEAARVEAAVNASGTAWEATLDQLGQGWVSTSIGDIAAHCDGDPLACVLAASPFVVQVDAAGSDEEWMNDWTRTGVAYHEMAHVLQFTNPDPTATALVAFGGDVETMADCYALTFLDGWSLDQKVWVSSYEYWDVSLGYGYTCDETQRQAIRDWSSQLGIRMRTLGG